MWTDYTIYETADNGRRLIKGQKNVSLGPSKVHLHCPSPVSQNRKLGRELKSKIKLAGALDSIVIMSITSSMLFCCYRRAYLLYIKSCVKRAAKSCLRPISTSWEIYLIFDNNFLIRYLWKIIFLFFMFWTFFRNILYLIRARSETIYPGKSRFCQCKLPRRQIPLRPVIG